MAFDPLPLPSLTNVSAVGAGTALDSGIARAYHAMVVTTSAGVTGGVVQLQGSLDGTNWFNLPGTSSVTTSAASTTTAATATCAARFIRAAVTTAITGGTVSAVVGMAN
jgi:hypothetical protein